MEIWKDIAGYEGLYQVSNFGNVRSLNWRKRGIVQNLYLKKQNRGYRHVELTKDGVRKAHTIHRLVAETFIPNPNNYPVINHKDEDKTNNNAANLEWCTYQHNVKHSMLLHPDRSFGCHSGGNPNKGKPYSRMDKVIQLSKDGLVLRVWDSLVSIKHEKGYNEWSIGECCRGQRKSAYGFKWQFAN